MPKLWERQPEILLLPNIPKPLHGVNPRTVLGTKWWNQERTTAYASTNYHCEACGISKKDIQGRKVLEGHEVYHTDYEQGRLSYIRTTPLCPMCHKFIHDGRLTMLLESKQISMQHFAAVMKHGQRVLSLARLSRPTIQERDRVVETMYYEGRLARWADWKLVVNNVEFGPKFATPEEADEHYRNRHGNNWLGPISRIETLSCDRMRRRAKSVLVGMDGQPKNKKATNTKERFIRNQRVDPFK
jgi:hypothetical protein